MAFDLLSAVGGALAGVLAAFGFIEYHYSGRRAAAQDAARPVYTCRCGAVRYDEHEARTHARETHNAPLQDGEWRYLFAEAA